MLTDATMVRCIRILITGAFSDILAFVFIHREILLVEILNSGFMVIRFEHFLNTSREWSLDLSFGF